MTQIEGTKRTEGTQMEEALYEEAGKMPALRLRLPAVAVGLRHFDQYLGVWCVEPVAFRGALEMVSGLDLARHIEGRQGDEELFGPAIREDMDGVAVIHIEGMLTKYGSSLSRNGGAVSIRKAVRDAARDPKVRALVLRVDSPGGNVAGISDLAEEVARARAAKPVTAYIEDVGASAAYWVASQAGKVFANTGAQVGSIGAYTVLRDSSGMAEKAGIRVHVVRAGAMKGIGESGVAVTDEHLGEVQRMVDGVNALMVGQIAKGRGFDMEQAARLNTGQVWLAGEALKLRLIDGIKTFDEAVGAARQENGGNQRRVIQMTDKKLDESAAPASTAPGRQDAGGTPVVAASFAELKAGLPGADAEFLCGQLEAGATLAQATRAWMERQNALVAAAQERAKAAEAAGQKPGAKAVTGSAAATTTEAAADPVEAWDQLVASFVAQGKSKHEAVRMAHRADPELHRAYVAAYNAAHGRQALVT